MADRYSNWTLADWEMTVSNWDTVLDEGRAFYDEDGLVQFRREDSALEYVEENFDFEYAGVETPKAFIELLRLDILEMCKRLGVKQDMGKIKWEQDDD